jgi:hypothetical protein
MADVHEVAAFKFSCMGSVIASALLIGWNWRYDLAPEQLLDCLFDRSFFGRCRIENADRDRPLPEQLACGAEFDGRLWTWCYVDAIHRNAHDRIGSFARVTGVRTI